MPTGRHKVLVPQTVVFEGPAAAVKLPSVELDHEVQVWPVHVDVVSAKGNIQRRRRQTGLAKQVQEPPLVPGARIAELTGRVDQTTENRSA